MTMSKVIARLLAPLAVALAMAPAAVRAQHPGGPCRQDVQRLCPDITPGPASFRACLKNHSAELSPACKERVSHLQDRMASARQACEADVQKFCSGVEPGRGRIMKCLHQHQAELSPACQEQFAQRGPHHHHKPPQATPAQTPTPGSTSNGS